MALPLLVAGADCGPVNPLQSLSKRFDQDRGIQQDQFVAGRAGSSHEPTNTTIEQEAAHFFSSGSHVDLAPSQKTSAASASASAAAFDLSLLHTLLPAPGTNYVQAPGGLPQLLAPAPASAAHTSPATANWAGDFMKTASANSITMTKSPGVVHETRPEPMQEQRATFSPMPMNQFVSHRSPVGMGMQWAPGPMSMVPGPHELVNRQMPTNVSSSSALWDKEFQSREDALQTNSSTFAPPSSQASQLDQQVQRQHDILQESRRIVETDELARTAGMLIDALKDEQNPKFKSSKFLAFMHDVRDGNVVVDGNDLVPWSEARTADANADAHGKGKERAYGEAFPRSNLGQSFVPVVSTSAQILGSQRLQEQTEIASEQTTEDANEAYFRQENEEYIKYWADAAASSSAMNYKQGLREGMARLGTFGQEWGEMQESWDSFEATTTGIKPVTVYRFQQHNPYLFGSGLTRTYHHSVHTGSAERSIYDSVLELEAQVQRNPTSSALWYDLGVKQQENEREAKAIAALQRSLQLDPQSLPAWLALAISYTNESNREAADEAIEQWIQRNGRYEAVVKDFFARGASNAVDPEAERALPTPVFRWFRKHNELIQCLMAMARSGFRSDSTSQSDEILVDADLQIALAVMLNISGEYTKAQDCFKTALSVRPDDWQLYNRVGATLANSGLCEDAFQYYYRALELNPTYIRARFNLGISCMNMMKFEEAANYILDALIMQDSDRAISAGSGKTLAEMDAEEVGAREMTSAVLWDNLRTSCLQLQRTDLANLCDQRDLEAFRHAFRSLGP